METEAGLRTNSISCLMKCVRRCYRRKAEQPWRSFPLGIICSASESLPSFFWFRLQYVPLKNISVMRLGPSFKTWAKLISLKQFYRVMCIQSFTSLADCPTPPSRLTPTSPPGGTFNILQCYGSEIKVGKQKWNRFHPVIARVVMKCFFFWH